MGKRTKTKTIEHSRHCEGKDDGKDGFMAGRISGKITVRVAGT